VISFQDADGANFHLCFSDNPRRRFPLSWQSATSNQPRLAILLKAAIIAAAGANVARVLINAAANVSFQSEVDMIRQAKPVGSVEK
jgi:hypothetical protein